MSRGRILLIRRTAWIALSLGLGLSACETANQDNRNVLTKNFLFAAQKEPVLSAAALMAQLPKVPTGERMCSDVDPLTSLSLSTEARTYLSAARGACNLPTGDVSLAEAKEQLRGVDIAYKVHGDVFTLYQRGPPDDPRIIRLRGVSIGPETCCSFQNGLWRRFLGTDLWVMRLRLNQIRYATISQQTSRGLDASPKTSVTYRGDLAPLLPVKTDKIAGTIEQLNVISPQLNETRIVVVYSPPQDQRSADMPVVVSEGSDIENYARISEALVSAKKTRPIILVGIIAGNDGIVGPPRPVPQHVARAQDYSPNRNDSTFKQYLGFLVDTVRPLLVTRYQASENNEDWAITGSSQGGALALNAGLERPDVFGHSWPMSIAGTNPALEPFNASAKKSKFRISAGYYEENFLVNSQLAASAILDYGGSVHTRWFSDGHNRIQWDQAFYDNLMIVFPNKQIQKQ